MANKSDYGPDYQVTVLRDFTGGLWERGSDRECPSNGLLECTDAYPLPHGGIRAAMAFQPLSQNGLASGADATGGAVPQGIYSHPGIFATQTIYLSEFQVNQGGAGKHRLRFYGLADEATSALTTAAWTPVATIGTSAAPITAFGAGTKTATLRNATNFYRAYFDLGCLPSSYAGVYNFTSSTSQLVFNANGPHGLVSNQSRLIFIAHETTVLGVPNQIQFTSASTDAAPSTANFVAPLWELSLPIQWVLPSAPSDILGLKLGAGLFNMQGDISAGPTIRQVTFDNNVSVMYPAYSDLGAVYHVEREGIFLWPQGIQTEQLSSPILGDPFASAEMGTPNWSGIGFNYRGALAVGADFLYAGRYVCDLRTKAWFKLSGLNYADPNSGGMPAYAVVDPSNHRIYLANYGRLIPGAPPTPQELWWSPLAENDFTRTSTFNVTLPIVDLESRNVELRGIEIFGQGFGSGGTWTPQLTPAGGVTQTLPAQTVAVRAEALRWNCRALGDNVKIRITSAGTAGSEAPMIDRIALYFQPRQQRPAP